MTVILGELVGAQVFLDHDDEREQETGGGQDILVAATALGHDVQAATFNRHELEGVRGPILLDVDRVRPAR